MSEPVLTLITPDYPPARGGVARYLSDLVRASEGGIEVVAGSGRLFRSTWPRWWPMVRVCVDAGRRGRTILVSHVIPVGTAAWIARMLGGPEYAVICHGLDVRLVSGTWKRWLFRQIMRGASARFANSRSTEADILAIDSSLFVVQLTPGVETSGFPTREEARRTIGIGEHDRLVVSVCRLVPRKGIDVALNAMARVQAEQKTEYVVIGDGEDRERLETIARDAKCSVRFISDADDEQKKRWLSAADVFLLPVRDATDDVEGFGIVYLEAAAAGIPSVAGKSGGAGEAVVDGATGIMCDPKDEKANAEAVKKLLTDAAERTRLGKNARDRVLKEFRWADRWGIVRSVITRSPRRSNPSKEAIAVIIPCFNHANVLRRTLESVEKQTLRPNSIVVIDDGSTDHPEHIVDSFKNRLPIRLIRFDTNRRAPAARNVGAQTTSEPLLLFLDADAELVPSALQEFANALQDHPRADFAFSNFFWGVKRFRGQSFDVDALKKRNYIHTSSLIRRSAFPGFDESLKKFQDWDLWLTMAERGSVGVWIDRDLFRIEPRKHGMSRWLPRIAHHIPWQKLGFVPKEITNYRDAEQIVRKKHGI